MILITGGTGLVGSHLLKELSYTNNSIIALYHTTKPNKNLMPFATWVQVDILDIVALEEVFEQGISQVYHCAALVSFYANDKQKIHQLNTEGTKNIVNCCLNYNVQKLLHVSSVATLDRFNKNDLVTEKRNDNGSIENSEYAKSKIESETQVWRGIAEGLNAVIVNPSIILGAGNWNTGSTAIFKNCYNQFPWFTNGSNGFVDVLDVAKAMISLMNSNINNERFIINGHNFTYKKVFDTIAFHFNKKPAYKLATPFLAAIAWRFEKIKSFFTGNNPLLTKETAASAQKNIAYSSNKLLKALPNFCYSTFDESIKRICGELIKK